MLQIISGKFFNSDDRYCHDAKGITFCNYSWFSPIKTCIATLEPVDKYASPSVASYVISYINQIEKEKPPRTNIIVRTGDSEIIEQFQLLCSFGLKAFFHQDRDSVAVACRESRRSSSDYHIPSSFVPRFFSKQIIGTNNEIDFFISFVEKVIGLRRDTYSVVIASIRNFVHALQILGHNIDLAYSLIIYSLESLSQTFDNYEPTWDDYQDEVRIELDQIFKELPKDTADQIRNILLRSSHLKLMRRFTDFITKNVNNSFFIEEAPNGYAALRKSELVPALRNAYYMRSRYTHQLQPIQEQIKHPHTINGDVIRWENQPYLSIAGLIRLAHHSITQFITNQESAEHEEINWRKELPCIMQGELAPQYWIWKYGNVKQEHSTQKLSGFLLQLEAVLLRGEPLTDLKELLSEYERLLPISKKQFQLRMFTLYYIYNTVITEENRSLNYKSTIEKYGYLYEDCTLESMLTLILLANEWPWDIKESENVWEQYTKQRFRKTGLKIAFLFEIALLVELANMHLKKEDLENYIRFLNSAILDAAGEKKLQSFLMKLQVTKETATLQQIINEAKQ